VIITNIVASSTGTQAIVQWKATPGFAYDVLVSGEPLDPMGSWSRAASSQVASASAEQFTDTTFGIADTQRYYQVVLSGEAPFSNGVWGVLRRDLPGGAYALVAPPLRSDRSFDGRFGRELAEPLSGHDGGPGDELGDELYLLEPGGRWRMLYLDRTGTWRAEDGTAASDGPAEGQGLLLRRAAGGSARATFVGEVGNDGTRQAVVREGWNILALSEGRPLSLDEAFGQATAGGPAGGMFETDADQVIVWDATGFGYWLMYDLAGRWVDTATFLPVALKLQPGDVLYYYRQPGRGTMKVTF
jgi:hypothetical protein